jgi:hypothetical protein
MSEEKTELELLKDRAKTLGIKHHPNIGVDKLRDKVNAAMQPSKEEELTEGKLDVVPQKSPNQIRMDQHKEMNKLVRIEISCNNPNKRAWPGEIFTVANDTIGTFKKFVPFNKPWHVPVFIYNMIKERECQIFEPVPNGQGNVTTRGKNIKEFNIRELGPITSQEFETIKQRQAARVE